MNDYFDYLAVADAGPSIGGSHMIQKGKISPGQILCLIILSYTFAFLGPIFTAPR